MSENMKIVECVPNFSEGKRKDVIESIIEEVKKTNVKLLDVESDKDHNRSVVTFIGSPDDVKKAAMKLGAKAIELIDLNKHKGEHPRMGAVDVVPFVPISDVTMEECVNIAREFAKEYAEKFKVPVYLYEEAATKPERKNLANIRKGQFEKLKDEIGKNPEKTPDFGPNRVHPTAGATAVGARMPLVAFNVNLGTSNLEVAKKIAGAVRAKDGGLMYVKAMGFDIKERNIVQVSMNMVNYLGTPLFRVFELIKSEAKRYGVPVIGSEIVGLVPMDALIDVADYYLQLENFKKDQILEKRLGETNE